MKENKFIKYQLIVVFLVIIALPGLLQILNVKAFERKDENRTFTDSVSLNLKKLDKLPGDFDAFAKDNFFFRTPSLELFHRLKFNIYNISPHPEKAIIGKDNWYFRTGRENEVMNGNLDFSINQLDSFSNEWKKRTEYFEQFDIPIFWVIAPIKHRIYTDKLPYNFTVSESNRVDDLKAHLKADFPNLIIDPSPLLKAKRDSFKLYFQLDNHWNERAGYLVSKLIIEKLKAEFPDKTILDLPQVSWEVDENFKDGFHHRVMGIEELSEVNETARLLDSNVVEAEKYDFKAIEGFPYPWAYEKRYVNKTLKNGLRVLFIRDSFGRAVLPFAKEAFKESVFIFDAWRFSINEEIVETVKPDVVIFLGLETNIENLLKVYE